MVVNPGLQISLNVKGKTCLVLGGEAEASEKTLRLLEAGARVTVIHPTIGNELKKLTASGKILHRGRRFRSSDTEGVFLIINTLREDRELASSLYELSLSQRFLVCSSDQPGVSNVMMPALVKQRHLRIAVSTSGVAPTMASRLRQDLEDVFDEKFGDFIEWLAQVRETVQQDDMEISQRFDFLRQAVEGFKFAGSIEYPAAWENKNQKAALNEA